jgi:hypothetical protein
VKACVSSYESALVTAMTSSHAACGVMKCTTIFMHCSPTHLCYKRPQALHIFLTPDLIGYIKFSKQNTSKHFNTGTPSLPGGVTVSALACQPANWSLNANRCKFFSDLNRALRLTQPQMGTRAIWEVNATCVCDANPLTTDKMLLVTKKYGH